MQHAFLFPANLAIKLGTCPSRRHKQSRGEIQMSPPHSPRFNPPQVQPHLILPHTALSAAWPGLISGPEPLSSMKRRTAGTCRLSRREANHNAVKWVRRPANLGQANAAVTCLEIKAQARKVLRDSNHVFLFFFFKSCEGQEIIKGNRPLQRRKCLYKHWTGRCCHLCHNSAGICSQKASWQGPC